MQRYLKNIKSSYFYVGFFIFVFTLSIYYLFTKILPNYFYNQNLKEYCLIFEDVKDIVPGTKVSVAGVKVGFVKEIRLLKNKAQVIIAIDKNIDLTNNTRAYLTSASLLGGYYISLDIKPGKKISSNVCLNNTSSLTVEDLINQIGQNLKKVNISKINEIINNTNTLILDINKSQKEIKLSINKTLKNINANLNLISKKFSKLIDNTNIALISLSKKTNSTLSSYEDLARTLSFSINETTALLKLNLENLNYLLNETKNEKLLKALKKNLDESYKVLKNLNDILVRVKNSNGTLWKLIEGDELYKNIESSLENITYLEKRVNNFLSKKYEFNKKIIFRANTNKNFSYGFSSSLKLNNNEIRLDFLEKEDTLKFTFLFSRYLNPYFSLEAGFYESKLALGYKLTNKKYFFENFIFPYFEINTGRKFNYFSIFVGTRYLYDKHTLEGFAGTSVDF